MGLIHDIASLFWPDNPEPTPPIVKAKGSYTRQSHAGGPRLVPIAGRLFVDEKDNGRDIEFDMSYTRAESANEWGQRQDKITDNDIEELQRRGVGGNLGKAAELKALWASGMSAADMARFYQGRWGFGERTLKSHIAAFNAASPGGGADGKQGAK